MQVLLRILSQWVSLIEPCECKAECLLVGLYATIMEKSRVDTPSFLVSTPL